MKKIKLSSTIYEYDSIEEIDKADKELLLQAKKACLSAYAPYSKYYVGAATLLENGKIFTGNNQENIATPSGMCAERVAVFSASSHYPETPIKAIAITSKAKDFIVDTPVTPCGACRQVLAEYETKFNSNIKLILMGETGKILIINSIKDILPLMFHADKLKK
ncbi:MAG: cytidine deaminase [Bacteroidales bacterium]|nr:cytidine deaminase [Bacteroidales bacterium]